MLARTPENVAGPHASDPELCAWCSSCAWSAAGGSVSKAYNIRSAHCASLPLSSPNDVQPRHVHYYVPCLQMGFRATVHSAVLVRFLQAVILL